MKKLILTLIIITGFTACKTSVEEPEEVSADDVIPFSANQIDAHNSRNSLEWEGAYSGVLPCENCVGIDTYIRINQDNTYTITQRYVDSADAPPRELKHEGKFIWNEEGSAITLERIEGDISTFRVGEMFLTPLQRNGIEIRREAGNNFKLLKQ
ncbi:copper resistance protein NlpE N-terminal domain-containing protein [soil metagenome]